MAGLPNLLGGVVGGAILKRLLGSDAVGVLRGEVLAPPIVQHAAGLLLEAAGNPSLFNSVRGLALEYAAEHGWPEDKILSYVPLVASLVGAETDERDPLGSLLLSVAQSVQDGARTLMAPDTVTCPNCNYLFFGGHNGC